MKKLRELIAILAIFAVGAVMTGCSGDDDDDSSGTTPTSTNTGPSNTGPGQSMVAPTSLAGKRYYVREPHPTEGLIESIVDFTSETAFVARESGLPDDVGTYVYTRHSDTAATLTLTHDDNAVSVINLNFQNLTYSGTYTPQNGPQENVTGTFSDVTPVDTTPTNTNPTDTTPTNTNPTDTNPTDTTPTNTNPTDTTPTNTQPTSGLAGRRVQFQFSGDSGQELITFSNSGSTFTSDISPGAGGTYTFTETADTITVNLQYDTPASFANDFLEATLTKGSSGTAGTFTGNYFYENQPHDVSGNWSFQQ